MVTTNAGTYMELMAKGRLLAALPVPISRQRAACRTVTGGTFSILSYACNCSLRPPVLAPEEMNYNNRFRSKILWRLPRLLPGCYGRREGRGQSLHSRVRRGPHALAARTPLPMRAILDSLHNTANTPAWRHLIMPDCSVWAVFGVLTGSCRGTMLQSPRLAASPLGKLFRLHQGDATYLLIERTRGERGSGDWKHWSCRHLCLHSKDRSEHSAPPPFSCAAPYCLCSMYP